MAEHMKQARADAAASSTPGTTGAPLPPLALETEEKAHKTTGAIMRIIKHGKTIKNLTDAYPKSVHAASGLRLKVVRMDNPVDGEYNGKKRPTVLLVEQEAEEPQPQIMIWASPKIKECLGDLYAGSLLEVKRWMKDDAVVRVLHSADDWNAPSDYKSIPAIAKGVPDGVQVLTIASTRIAKDKDYIDLVVFKDTEGRVWRFKNYNHSHKFTLEDGHGINVPAWTRVRP